MHYYFNTDFQLADSENIYSHVSASKYKYNCAPRLCWWGYYSPSYVSMQAKDFKRAKHVPAAIVNLSLMLDCFSWMTLNNLSEVTWTE